MDYFKYFKNFPSQEHITSINNLKRFYPKQSDDISLEISMFQNWCIMILDKLINLSNIPIQERKKLEYGQNFINTLLESNTLSESEKTLTESYKYVLDKIINLEYMSSEHKKYFDMFGSIFYDVLIKNNMYIEHIVISAFCESINDHKIYITNNKYKAYLRLLADNNKLLHDTVSSLIHKAYLEIDGQNLLININRSDYSSRNVSDVFNNVIKFLDSEIKSIPIVEITTVNTDFKAYIDNSDYTETKRDLYSIYEKIISNMISISGIYNNNIIELSSKKLPIDLAKIIGSYLNYSDSKKYGYYNKFKSTTQIYISDHKYKVYLKLLETDTYWQDLIYTHLNTLDCLDFLNSFDYLIMEFEKSIKCVQIDFL